MEEAAAVLAFSNPVRAHAALMPSCQYYPEHAGTSLLERSQEGSWLAQGGRLGWEKKWARKSSVTGALEWEQRRPA